MAAQHDVFIAYAGPDRSVAEEVVMRLQQRGVAVRWDGHLQAEESFSTGIGELISSCLVFAVIVSSHTWDGQHYATDELAMAIELARDKKIVVVPVWVDEIPLEKRPYGMITQTGVSVDGHAGCLSCVAGRLYEVVLRTKLAEAYRQLSAYITAEPLLNIIPAESPNQMQSKISSAHHDRGKGVTEQRASGQGRE